MPKLTKIAAAIMAANAWALAAPAVHGQEGHAKKGSEIEEVFVTGSYIRRKSQFDSASPLTTVGSEDFAAIGAKDIRDVVESLTANSGAQNNADSFTQFFSPGTSNVNLRGLGVDSTLVLLNGRRQVLNTVQTADGKSFVDTSSLVPTIALERVEILKDGASALYGTDAVAGVVNFITNDDYDGVKVSFDYQEKVGDGDQADGTVQLMAGVGDEKLHIIGAISYFDRTDLTGGEVDWFDPIDNSSGLGHPATYFGALAAAPTAPVMDPDCAAVGGIPQVLGASPDPSFQVGLCRYDFGYAQALVAEERRVQGYTKVTYDFSEATSWYLEYGFANNRGEGSSSPSFPNAVAPTVPASHPANPFDRDVVFFGRPYGTGVAANALPFTNETYRFSTGADGAFNDSWHWDLAYTRAVNEYTLRITDTVADNLQAALTGFGGSDCLGSGAGVAPGVGDCLYFNPFATSFSAQPGDPTFNDPSIKSFILGQAGFDGRSTLDVLDAVVSGELWQLPGGTLGLAFGLQYRQESLAQDWDSLSNQNGWAFILGNPDFSDDRDVNAAFVELALPLTDDLELQLAARYEDYGSGVGDTFDPKIAAIFTPTEKLTLRASWGSSFKAPSLFQTSGVQTAFQQITDVDGSSYFIAARTFGQENLAPQEADALNLGLSWAPVEDLELNLDYWSFDFTDVLVKESSQAIIDADPNDPRVVRTAIGTVIEVQGNIVNASSVKTDGIDLVVTYTKTTDVGSFQPRFDATYLLSYDLEDPQAGKVNGKGLRNSRNFGDPAPELRANLGLNWLSSDQQHSANVFVRYIDSYEDDQTPGQEIDSHTTVDAQYNYHFEELLGDETTLTLGVINLFDEEPPFIAGTNGNYDSRTHDPRGRRVYLSISTEF